MKCQKWFVSNQRNERRRAERPRVRLFEDFKGSLRISHVRKYSSCSVVAKHNWIVKHRICFGSACETAQRDSITRAICRFAQRRARVKNLGGWLLAHTGDGCKLNSPKPFLRFRVLRNARGRGEIVTYSGMASGGRLRTPPSFPMTRDVERETFSPLVALPTLPAASVASTRTNTLAGTLRAGCHRYSPCVSTDSAIVAHGPSMLGE